MYFEVNTMKHQKQISTFSIVAFSPDEESWGIAVASKFLAVGAIVPYAKTNVGAMALQSVPDLSSSHIAFESLKDGADAHKVMDMLLENDKLREVRQIGIIDKDGNPETFTGEECSFWAGGITGKYYAIQGNLLVGKETVENMASVFETAKGELADRLLESLLAGDRAGGDRRGKQSAALLVVKSNAGYGGNTDKYIDLRIDNHTDPVEELGKLLELHHIYLGVTDTKDKITIGTDLAKKIQVFLHRRNLYSGELNGVWDTETKQAFFQFIDVENLEERVDIDNKLIDPPALTFLQQMMKEE
jgi:uncharacterized Ntn-hydrolase superfamily protein